MACQYSAEELSRKQQVARVIYEPKSLIIHDLAAMSNQSNHQVAVTIDNS